MLNNRRRNQKSSFGRNSSLSANRHRRKRFNQHRKVLWRHRTFTLREFANQSDLF